jgi:hypothetical protein
LKKKRPQK